MKFSKSIIIWAITAFWIFTNFPLSAQSEWKSDLVFYGWFAGLDGTMGLGRQEIPVEADFSDLFNHLDFGFGGHYEARNPKVSLIGDVLFMNLGEEGQFRDTRITAVADFKVWVFEGAAGYRLSDMFEILLAGRLYNMNAGIEAKENSVPNRSTTWADIYLGARFRQDFAQKWFVALRGDVGLGGSDFAWFGNAALGYRFSDLFSLSLAYRILSLDYKTGERVDFFKWDVITDGFGIGLGFSF